MLLIHARSSVYMRVDFAVNAKQKKKCESNSSSGRREGGNAKKLNFTNPNNCHLSEGRKKMWSLTEYCKNPCVVPPSVKLTLSAR